MGITPATMVGLTDGRLPRGVEQKDEVSPERIRAMRGPEDHSDPHDGAHPKVDLILSLVDGFVWVCWPGTNASVRLGNHEPVIAVMRDFLAQCELGERLTNGEIVDD